MNYAGEVLQFFPKCPLCFGLATIQVNAGPFVFRDSMRCLSCGTGWHLHFGIDALGNVSFNWAALDNIGSGAIPELAQYFAQAIGAELVPPQWFQVICELDRVAQQSMYEAQTEASRVQAQPLQGALAQPSSIKVRCHTCGGLSDEDAVFCSKCGKRL
jgi:hypothetical protein